MIDVPVKFFSRDVPAVIKHHAMLAAQKQCGAHAKTLLIVSSAAVENSVAASLKVGNSCVMQPIRRPASFFRLAPGDALRARPMIT
jgi:hypothetical protein